MKERKLEVYLGERFVGTMAQTADRRVAFAYSEEWLDNGFAISPFSLPVEQRVFVPTSQAFSGLWGVFADSLPDAWGQLLVDRMLKARGILSADMTQLERLAIVGDSGMGALSYRPAWNIRQDAAIDDLDELSAQCHAILNHEDAGDLDELFQMGGSSGGARPKIMTDEWIIKFPASDEMKDSGTMEKAYMDCAADCGIIVPETKLMPSSVCAGYFAVKRFDRRKTDGHIERRHMLTAAAILEVDWRTAAMDYHTLKGHIINYVKTREVYAAYRMAGYSKKFVAEHEQEIRLHQAAKEAFSALGTQKIPKVKAIQAEYDALREKKKQAYAAYHQAQDEMRQLLTVRANVERILGIEEKEKERQKEKKKER